METPVGIKGNDFTLKADIRKSQKHNFCVCMEYENSI